MLNDEAGGLSLNGLLATAKNKQTKKPTTVIVGYSVMSHVGQNN